MKAWLLFCLVLFSVAPAWAAELPAPIRALQKQGLNIRGEMSAPAGFKGYVGEYQGQSLPIYLLPDGKHTMIGSLYDAQGNDLTRDAFTRAAAPKVTAADWKQLGQLSWIGEGAKSPKRIVYVFSDTECPYCHRLWHDVQPLLAGGDVQVRYLLVAVIAPDSLGRAAAIMHAADPAKAFREHESDFRHSPIQPLKTIPTAIRKLIAANSLMMNKLGAFGTPAIVYRDAEGFHVIAGMPSDPARVKAIFGH